MQHQNDLEDLLDRLAAEYTDQLEAGAAPSRRTFLDRVPPAARPGLERCLKALDAGSVRATFRPLGAGTQLGRFEVVREIGRGGMALVFLAQDPDLRRTVALKVLRPGLAIEQTHVDRFLREGHSMARLQHPGVVQVFDVGETDGYHWIAMEYVEGPSLATVIEALTDSAMSVGGALRVEHLVQASGAVNLASSPSFEAACARLLGPAIEGLTAAHSAELVHRDIKPSNVLIRRDGHAVLADFGLARADGDPALSMTGSPIGTPHYMAPEQAEAADQCVDERTDVYGFGATLYELLGQKRPFEGENVVQILDAIRMQPARPLRTIRSALSRDAESVCTKAMRHTPSERYATAGELAADLERLSVGDPTVARVAEGGPLRRWFAHRAIVQASQPNEYRSDAEFLGWPLLHVVGGVRRPGQKIPCAKGWIAVGPRAVGALAIGGAALGGISLGGISLGLIAFGGLAAGGAANGGSAIGVRALGGVAIGHVAAGGLAVGYGAIGGGAFGVHAVSGAPGASQEAIDFFDNQPAPYGKLYRYLLDMRDPRRHSRSPVLDF